MRAPSLPQLMQPVNDLLRPLVKAGLGSPLNWTPGLVVLEVPGRQSGREYSLPLLGYLAYPYVTLATVRPNSQWVKNTAAASEPHVWVWGRRFSLDKVVVTDQLIVGRLTA